MLNRKPSAKTGWVKRKTDRHPEMPNSGPVGVNIHIRNYYHPGLLSGPYFSDLRISESEQQK